MTQCIKLDLTTRTEACTMIVELPYLADVSINHCFNRGQVRFGYKQSVRDWKQLLKDSILAELNGKVWSPPIHFQYLVLYPSRTRKGDPPNMNKIIQDAIAEALGFDDTMENVIGGPHFGFKTRHKEGKIIISIHKLENIVVPDFLLDKIGTDFVLKE